MVTMSPDRAPSSETSAQRAFYYHLTDHLLLTFALYENQGWFLSVIRWSPHPGYLLRRRLGQAPS